MSSAPGADEIAKDARWLVQALDPASGLARLIAMDRDGYRAASFLDDRMLQQPVRAEVLQWTDVAAAVPEDARADARWIFHIGHVGSTLVARLLGELDGVLAIREPRILRDVALLPPQQRATLVPVVRTLLSRTFAASETAVVKATSFVGEIAGELVQGGGRALFLFVGPRAYIATILAAENSPLEMKHLAASRQQRLASRGIVLAEASASDAHLAAAAWACEMTALEAAAEAISGPQPMWHDFDRFLGEPAASLGDIAEFFGFAAPPEQVRAVVAGPLMRRYSKALEYDYSPQLRRDILDEALATHRTDIDAALAMLARAGEKAPLLARALQRAQTES